ncbi:MAG: phosphatidate cytidylyltransferase [Nitriliruptorales bacterium]|nr:phosphatidate cytidylyltransferase [Nitriliruptorales bacterium]
MSRRRPTPDATRAPRRRAVAGRNLPAAIVSGVILAVLFLGTLFWNNRLFLAFWAVLITIGLFELDKALRLKGVRPALPVVIGAGLVVLFGTYTHGAAAQAVGLVLLLLGSMAWTLLDVGRGQVVASIGASCLMGLWVPFLASFAVPLLVRPQGEWYVVAAVALTVSGDIGAYGFGNAFGKHKLAPSISPAKSWEGFIGGLAVALLVAGLIVSRLAEFDVALALVFGVGCFLAGTLGDLAESMVKRDLGVKDLGGIVPGHGGIMDRADAVIFALPVAHAVLSAFGR